MRDLSLATKLFYSAGSIGTGAFYSFNNFVLPPILKSFGAPDLLIGLLRGDGAQTLQRVYWCNKATGITADVPSEAELTPRLWGVWEFR